MRSQLQLFIVAVIVFLFLISLWDRAPSARKLLRNGFYSTSDETINSTLGFGAIYVVSGTDGGERRHDIIQAANVTEIDLTIPELPAWGDEDEKKFNQGIEPPVSRGSVFAWLSHRLVLEKFLASDAESALILEDDVDWDIRLRTQQIPLIAAGIRSLLPSAFSSSHTPHDPSYPYGAVSDWDILYLGHCGDWLDTLDKKPFPGIGYLTPQNLSTLPHKLLHDATLPHPYNLHPFTVLFLTALGTPPQTRLVHKSIHPLCTFAYAVTRSAAAQLLHEIAVPRANNTQYIAFDVAMLRACTVHNLRCWSANPELFHHKVGKSLIGLSDQKEKFLPPVDATGLAQVQLRNETSNIECGFFSRDFEFEEGTEEGARRLQELRKMVREGRCEKQWKERELDP